jgi:hypothetical protein
LQSDFCRTVAGFSLVGLELAAVDYLQLEDPGGLAGGVGLLLHTIILPLEWGFALVV